MDPIVITGLGVVSPLGQTVEEFFKAQLNGRHGFLMIDDPHFSRHAVKVYGAIRDFDAGPILAIDKGARRYARFGQFGCEAARQALIASRLVDEGGRWQAAIAREAVATVGGCGIGGLPEYEDQTVEVRTTDSADPRRVSPYLINELIGDGGPGGVSILFGLRGSQGNIQGACASGLKALIHGCRLLTADEAEAVVVVSAEACLTFMCLASFDRMRALSRSPSPDLASRPFDVERDGFVISEGAAACVLVRQRTASETGLPVQATVLGYGESADACSLTEPSADGQVRAMNRALNKYYSFSPSEIDLMVAHGTSTPTGDQVESQSIATVFGSDNSQRTDQLLIYSGKGHHGHPCGPAGLWSLITAIQVLERAEVPAIRGLCSLDPACQSPALRYLIGQTEELRRPLNRIMVNAFGFCGTNASVIVGRP